VKKATPQDPLNSALNVDKYIQDVPEPARSSLRKIRAMIRSVVPPETTETISYGIPTFKYKGALFGYAAFSKHCSLFSDGFVRNHAVKDDLKGFQTSKAPSASPWTNRRRRL
jgi:uncharacterized protein YdhG (YjbR/CyaY superfamily)